MSGRIGDTKDALLAAFNRALVLCPGNHLPAEAGILRTESDVSTHNMLCITGTGRSLRARCSWPHGHAFIPRTVAVMCSRGQRPSMHQS